MDKGSVRIRPVRTTISESGEEIGIYPVVSSDVAKIARERGLSVVFDHDREHRRYQVLEGADLWMPALEFGVVLVTGLGTNLLSDIIKELLSSRREDEESQQNIVIHLDVQIIQDGQADAKLTLD